MHVDKDLGDCHTPKRGKTRWGPDILPHILCTLPAHCVFLSCSQLWSIDVYRLSPLVPLLPGIFKEPKDVCWVGTDDQVALIKKKGSERISIPTLVFYSPQFNSYVYTHLNYFFCFKNFESILPNYKVNLGGLQKRKVKLPLSPSHLHFAGPPTKVSTKPHWYYINY